MGNMRKGKSRTICHRRITITITFTKAECTIPRKNNSSPIGLNIFFDPNFLSAIFIKKDKRHKCGNQHDNTNRSIIPGCICI